MEVQIPIEETDKSARLTALEAGLAVLWLILPAVQYLGAVRRAQASVKREIPLDSLARLDLMPWYIILIGLTLIYVTLRTLARDRLSGAREDGRA